MRRIVEIGATTAALLAAFAGTAAAHGPIVPSPAKATTTAAVAAQPAAKPKPAAKPHTAPHK